MVGLLVCGMPVHTIPDRLCASKINLSHPSVNILLRLCLASSVIELKTFFYYLGVFKEFPGISEILSERSMGRNMVDLCYHNNSWVSTFKNNNGDNCDNKNSNTTTTT